MSIHTRALIANFNGGELSPLLDARVDASAYRNGCRKLENFIVRPYGGVFKRPGTEYGGAVKTAGKKTRLIAFKRSTNKNYILEFGDGYIRFWEGGSSMTRVESSPGTAYEVVSPYLEADLFQIQVCQINDVMFIAHPNYAPRKLSYTSATSWALAVITWDFPPMLDLNDTSTTVTIQPNVPNWATSTAYTVGQTVLQGGSLYVCTTAHTSGTFATDLAASPAKWKITRCRGPWERGKNFDIGDVVSYSGALHVTTTNHTSADSLAPPYTYWTALSFTGIRLFSSAAIFSASDVGGSWRIDTGANQRTIFISGNHSAYVTYRTQSIFAQGSMLVRSNFNSTNGAPLGDLYLEQSFDNITFNSVKNWRFQANKDGNLSSEYEGEATGAFYRLRWEPEALSSIAEGFFLEAVTGLVSSLATVNSYNPSFPLEVTCTYALPNVSVVPCELLGRPTTLWFKPAFTSSSCPRSVAFHDSRLFWGGVAGQPSRIWGSRLDDYYNYLTGADDDSALDLTLAATEANQVEWITSFGRSLVCGTTGEEWTIDAGDQDATLTPTSVRARRRTRHGSSNVAPQPVSDALLWVARGGRRMKEFSYNFASDSYQAPDMTQLAEHVTEGGIVQTAFSADPDSMLWAVTGGSNGILLGFTYDRAQQITAWHRHTTDGTFESVATIYGTSGRDEVWFVVKRTVNGSTVRYIERFYPTAQNYDFGTATDLFYVDCGKKVSQASSTTVSGLSHLNAKAVLAVADGARIESKTVSAGAITLDAAATSIIVGLPITSTVQPMKQEIMLQDGTGQGRKWRPDRVYFRLHKSYGGQFSDTLSGTTQNIDARTPYQIEQNTTLSAALQTTEVDEHIKSDWSGSVDFNVTHSDPLPFNLLAWVLVYQVEGS